MNIKIADDYFPIRNNKIKNIKIEYTSSEIPEVEIYSGLFFSINFLDRYKYNKIINGGRFDQMSSSLGLRPIKAVGSAINL